MRKKLTEEEITLRELVKHITIQNKQILKNIKKMYSQNKKYQIKLNKNMDYINKKLFGK